METLRLPNITLQGYAQGGWQTSIFVPEIKSVFDVGILLPVKANHYFLTHGHPDHSGALPYLIARMTVEQKTHIINLYYPKEIDLEIKTALVALSKIQGDRGDLPVNFWPVSPGDIISLENKVKIKALRTFHRVPSIGWAVQHSVKKLKPEFSNLNSNQIIELKKNKIEITYDSVFTSLVIPGDTTIDFLRNHEEAQNAKVLVHEVTTWGVYPRETCAKYGHTHVDDILEFGNLFKGDHLVLVHRSMKHSREEVENYVIEKFPENLKKKVKIFDGGDN